MPSTSNNVFNSVRGYLGLFGQTNKTGKGDADDDTSTILPEFESSMNDEEVLTLTKQWSDLHETYIKDIKQQQKDNLNYWLGRQFNEFQTAGTKRPLVDNLMFEAVETFLPIATRANPEANVAGDGTKDGDRLAYVVRNALKFQADRQSLRMKLKGVTRNWVIYMTGVAKIVWDVEANDIDTKVILPSRCIFDGKAEIGVGGVYHGDFFGEKKSASARRLCQMFPKRSGVIKEKAQGQMATRLTFIEWTTPRDLLYTLDGDTVLGKFKNPHWNYDGEVTRKDPETGEDIVEFVRGRNHFSAPQINYVFLTVFNLGRRPHDETSLIYQNIPLQDLVNRTYQQIDRNVAAQNNGIVLSGKSFTKEQAAEAALQLSRGNALYVPDGAIGDSYHRDQAPSLSGDVFNFLRDGRNEIRNIFGTSGATPAGLAKEDTARGKILINQLDASRIGGGVTEYIEGVAETIVNWWVQMMYVHYTEEHSFSVLGQGKGQELITLKNTDFLMKLNVTVKDGSLIPKDPLLQRNEAMDLWSAQAIDPINLFTKLDFPNPYESAKELVIWQMIQKGQLPPTVMFPDLPVAPPQNAPNLPPNGAVSGAESNQQQQPAVPVGGQSAPQLPPEIQGQALMHTIPV